METSLDCTHDLPGCTQDADYTHHAGHYTATATGICHSCAGYYPAWQLYPLAHPGPFAPSIVERHKGAYPPPPDLPLYVLAPAVLRDLRRAKCILDNVQPAYGRVMGIANLRIARTWLADIERDLANAYDLPHLPTAHPAGGTGALHTVDHPQRHPDLGAMPHGSNGHTPGLPLHPAPHHPVQPSDSAHAAVAAVTVGVTTHDHLIVLDITADLGDGRTLHRQERFPAAQHVSAVLNLAAIAGTEIEREAAP